MPRAKTAPDQGVLFGPPPVEPVGKLSAPPPGAGARWTAYKAVTRIQCDDCVTYLHQHDGVGPAVRSARWKRISQGSELMLCQAHSLDRGRVERNRKR